jgi:predicted transcriptional regulator
MTTKTIEELRERPDRVLHAIRHTFCSTLFEYGATIPEAAQAMGITLKQVETYAHPLRPMASVFEKAHRFGPKKVEDDERKSLTPKKHVG